MTPGSVCVSHLEFMKWADEIVLGALSKAPADKVSADLGNSFKSMLDTLNHVYLAELVWLRRVHGEGNAQLADLATPVDRRALARAWPEVHRTWLDWAGSRGANDWNRLCTHRNAAGAEFSMPYSQIVLHVVNHGSYHRGQVATMLRQSGVTPPGTDLITFCRTRTLTG
jgi:uncharacterized damage-inducible protein DinB